MKGISLDEESKTALATLVLSLVAAPVAHAYDPVADFPLAANQSLAGVWSYGQSSILGGAFTLLTVAEPANPFNANIESWRETAGGFDGGFPIIAHNKSAVTQTFLTVIHPTDELLMHPAPNGQYSVLRFTAPAAGCIPVPGRLHRSRRRSGDDRRGDPQELGHGLVWCGHQREWRR